MNLRIATTHFAAAIEVFAIGLIFLTVVLRRRKRLRFLSGGTALLAIFLAVAAGVNAYFQYVPTVGSIFGKDKDVVTLASVKPALGAGQPVATHIPDHGSVVQISIPGTVSGFHGRDASVYLPPRWFVAGTNPLPVIELMHGTPGMPQDWIRGGGVQEVADAWAAQHDGYAPIFIMPDSNGTFTGDTECVDGKLGNAETYLSQDVHAFAISQFHAASDRKSWAVGGLSEGGYCGAMLALRHPDMYSVFLDFGGEARPEVDGGLHRLFPGTSQEVLTSENKYDLHTLIRNSDHKQPVSGWFIAGGDDREIVRSNASLHTLAQANHLDTQLVALPNGPPYF